MGTELTTRQEVLKSLNGSEIKFIARVNTLKANGYVLPEERVTIILRNVSTGMDCHSI